MRVISGTARGRRLKEPDGFDIRPTTDQVKEAMFSILHFDLSGSRVLDLFGGTGQLAIEAKSRGAAQVTVVEQDSRALKLIRENIKTTGLDISVLPCDGVRYLESEPEWDILLLDPPYDSDCMDLCIECVKKIDKTKEHAIIACETRKEKDMPDLSAYGFSHREYRYGKIKLTVYRKDSNL